VAKKIMFGAPVEAAPQREAAGGRKGKGRSSRRETWCPGQSAWEPPLAGGVWVGWRWVGWFWGFFLCGTFWLCLQLCVPIADAGSLLSLQPTSKMADGAANKCFS